MHFTERRFARLGDGDPLEQEFRDVQRVIERARRNRWFGGDVLAPEFAPVPSPIVAPRPLRSTAQSTTSLAVGAGRGPTWRGAP